MLFEQIPDSNKGVSHTREQKPPSGNKRGVVWEQQEATGQWEAARSEPARAGALGFFIHSMRSRQRVLRTDDMIWLHFEKGHSVCFERREIEGMQECEAPDQPHSS